MTKFEKIYWIFGFLIVLILITLSIVVVGLLTFIFMDSIIIPLFPSIVAALFSLLFFLYSSIITILQFMMENFIVVFDWFKEIIMFIHAYKPPDNLLLNIVIILVTLIGISLPLSVGIVGQQLAPYKDPDISKMFKQEIEYKVLHRSILILPLFLLIHFLKINYSFLTIALLLVCFILLVTFFLFIEKVFNYMINTDEIIHEKQKKTIEKIIK